MSTMHVVVLNAVVQDAETVARRAPEPDAEKRKDARRTETRDRRPAAQGDVDGVRPDVWRPANVRYTWTTARNRPSAGAGAASAPRAGRWKFELSGSSHLNTAIIAL